MPFTIASLLNTPKSPVVVVGMKRSASSMSFPSNDVPNKRRMPHISPDYISVKSEDETLERDAVYSEHLTRTCPGWLYWLPPPGEPLPLYEPIPAANCTLIHNTPRGAGLGLGLGLGVSVALETIEIEEPEHTDGSPAPHYYSNDYANPCSSLEAMNVDPSPRYVPPSPLDLLAQSLVRSFIAWRQDISPSVPISKSEAKVEFNTTNTSATPNYILRSTSPDLSPRYVPPSPIEVITRYLVKSFAAWRPHLK